MKIDKIAAIAGILIGVPAIMATVWVSFDFGVKHVMAGDMVETRAKIEQLDEKQTGLTLDFYQREYNRLQTQVWEFQQKDAPPTLLQPFIQERDRAQDILEHTRTRQRSLIGVPIQ